MLSACASSPGSVGSDTGDGGERPGRTRWRTTRASLEATSESTEARRAAGDDTGGVACGNGVTDPGEACDDANDLPGDGCEADCVETTIVEVHAGGSQSCVVLEGGAIKCWGWGVSAGYGDWQNIGDNEFIKDYPVVPIGEPVAQLSVGGFTCALLEASSGVKCWGINQHGQSGLGPQNTDFDVGDDPEEIPELLPEIDLGGPVSKVAVGNLHACALLQSGDVRCWGQGEWGKLGQGNQEDIGDDEVPADLPPVDLGGVAAKDILAGASHSCAVTVDDDLICWGANYVGQLGYGHSEDIGDDELPASQGVVPLGGKVQKIEVGWAHACVELDTAPLKCWGGAGSSALGPSTNSAIGDDEPASQGVAPVFSGPLVGLARSRGSLRLRPASRREGRVLGRQSRRAARVSVM